MSRQEDFIEAGIQYRLKRGKPMCIAGSDLADVERDLNRVMPDIGWIRDSHERYSYGERVVPLHDVLKVIAAIENRIGPLTIEEED